MHPPCIIPAPFSMSDERRSTKRELCFIYGGTLTLCNGDLCDCGGLEPPAVDAGNVDGDEADGFADWVGEAVTVTDAVRHEGVVVESLDPAGGVPADGRDVAVVGEGGRLDVPGGERV